MKISLKVIITFSLAFTFHHLLAQDPQLSQFYASPIYTNPAFAGSSKKIRFSSSARNQYIGLDQTYKTAVATLDASLPKISSGLGLISMYDQAGDGFLSTTSLGVVYAYNLAINRFWNMNFGIQSEIRQRFYDFNRFTFGDQLDAVRGRVFLRSAETGINNNIIFPNFAAGVLVYNEHLYAGIAVHNLIKPNQSFTSASTAEPFVLPRRYTVHAGGNITLKKARNEMNKVYLSPNFLFMSQREFYQLNIGTYIKKQSLTFGMWYRQTSVNADALIFMAGLRFNNLRVGYSYDLTISKASTTTVGSHEISFAVDIKTPRLNRVRKPLQIKCPDF
jgi:type IX secretion system PorP/SprF family membrane protein